MYIFLHKLMNGQPLNNFMINYIKNSILLLMSQQLQPMQNAVDFLRNQMMDSLSLGITKLYFVTHHTEEKSENG